MTARNVDRRAVGLFVVLDLLTYALIYWLVVPAFGPVLAVLEPVTAVAVDHVLTAVRLTFLGAVAVRSSRARRGLRDRSDAVPTVLVAAAAGWTVHLVLGVVASLLVGSSPWSWGILLALVEWLAFACLGALFVAPGDREAERVPLRYRRMAQRESGSVSLFLVPAIAALVAVTLTAVIILGSATNDRRESGTAADAAALAAGEVWDDALGARFGLVRAATDPGAFWDIAGRPLSAFTPEGDMRARAAAFAARNGAELVDFDVDYDAAEVTVRVRNLETVPDAGRQMESTATSALRFRSGLCRNGAVLGLLISGHCHLAAPVVPTPTTTPTPTPTPTPSASPTPPPPPPPPPPFELPPGLGVFGMDVVLTDGS